MSRPEYLRSDPQKRRSKMEYLVIAILVVALFAGSFLWRAIHHEKPVHENESSQSPIRVAPVAPGLPSAQTGVQPKTASRAPN